MLEFKNRNEGQQEAACQQPGDGEEEKRNETYSTSHHVSTEGDFLARYLKDPTGLALQA